MSKVPKLVKPTLRHEASSSSQPSMRRVPLRRSRSAFDLGAGPSNLGAMRQNLKLKPLTKPATKPLLSTAGKSVVGNKRPLANQVEVEGPKPKLFKKIPDWDYKARFNQLTEKYQLVTKELKTLKQNSLDLEELRSVKIQMESQIERLTDQNQTLQQRVDNQMAKIQNLEECNNKLENRNQQLEADLKDAINCQMKLQTDNKKLLKESEESCYKISSLSDKVKAFEEEISNLKPELIRYESERRVLHNVIQDLKGNIRVFCRVRPRLEHENNKVECSITFPEENSLVLHKKIENFSQVTGKSLDSQNDFIFDRVFGPWSTQENVFEDLAQLVQSAVDGYNVCVFAYGQTGSGKTYTMQGGNGPYQGVIPRAIHLIFDTIEKMQRTGWKYTVQVSFVEIYNEVVRDLLNLTGHQKLDICYNEGRGTTVNNLTIQTVKTAEELENFSKKAHQCRATAATDFNEHSSRSHAITKIFLKGVNHAQRLNYESSINLVDLAGSESAKNAIAGDRLNETKSINKSLCILGDVISALYNKSRHIPYRNSKLTFLLQSCLSGNSKTLMIVNIAPFEECLAESIRALRFAAKVKEVKTVSKRNKAVTDTPV